MQSVELVVIPNDVVIVKGETGNEIANISIDDQVKLIQAIRAGNPAISRKIQAEVPQLQAQVTHLVSALQLIVHYADSGTYIGNLGGCQDIARKALAQFAVLKS